MGVGDRITALTNGGGYAEFCAVDARHCCSPTGLSLAEAASLPETMFTVWSNLFVDAQLKAGETMLVHGGAGGIGSTAIQMAKARGRLRLRHRESSPTLRLLRRTRG
jgi:NADPH2:quinone reductase